VILETTCIEQTMEATEYTLRLALAALLDVYSSGKYPSRLVEEAIAHLYEQLKPTSTKETPPSWTSTTTTT
jgi:hypothetical protein